ncbi:MAG: GAF domain-containing protein [bacterium]|nr:GAF domain-containing protein [bacterium]
MSDLSTQILATLGSGKSSEQMIPEIVLLVQKFTSIESVGLRLADGFDYPYYFTRGFDQDFVNMEMHLCEKDHRGELIRDSEGNPVLECMCGNVICGRTDRSLPFFTEKGSFWSNCTTDLLASTTDEDRQTRTRNRCNGEGYESVALVPVMVEGNCYGLLQLNDRRKDMFSLKQIHMLEGVAVNIGLLVSMIRAREHLASQAADVVRAATIRGDLLERLARELREKEPSLLSASREESILTKIDHLLEEVETLKGIVPICSICKRVRVDTSYWTQVEAFVQERSKAEFSHTFCPGCYDSYYAEQLGDCRAKGAKG